MGLESVRWIDFQDVVDERGRLTAIEVGQHVPFSIERVFYVHRVVPGMSRGGHAHRETDQLILSVNGTLDVLISDGRTSRTYRLDNPARGIYSPRMIWVQMDNFSPGAVCLVLASTNYDRSKSIRTWREYLDLKGLPYMNEPDGKMFNGIKE